MPILDKILYDSGIDTTGFHAAGAEIKKQLNELGSVATKTFEQDFGRALAKSIDPNNLRQGLDRSRKLLDQFGDDARKSFERTFQRDSAKRLFQPFVDETKTFSGQIKAQLKDALNLKNIAIGTAAGFLSAGAITGIIRGLFDIGKATTQLAADAAETRSKFNVVFGDLADETRSFANTFSDSVGRARIDTEEFLSSFQGLLEPMGLTNREAADFSKTLTKLAVDVASFNNKLDADVVRDFQSALVGETEPVKKYGIVLNETRLKQEALNQGLITAGQALTEQQKLHLRYQILLKDTVAAQGDAIRTSDSLVNQQKALAANFKNLGETIGAAVVPGINSVVTAINSLLSTATDTEKLITDLQKLGVAANELDFLNVIAQTERAQKSIDDLSSEIEALISDVTFLGAGLFTINPKTLIDRLFGNAQTVRDVALGFVEIAEQADGLNTLQEEIGKSTQKILDLTKQLVEVRAGRAGGDAEQIRKEIDLERERAKIAGQVLQFKQAIAAQEKIIADNNQQQTETVLDGMTVEAKRLSVAEQTTAELKAMLAANQGNRKEIEKELAAREKTAKFIEDIRKQLKLIAEQDDIGRKLTQIRQEADERRKLYADSAEAVKLIGRLEREERRKTLDDFEKKLREEIKIAVTRGVLVDLVPEIKLITKPVKGLLLPAEIEKLEIEIDEAKARTIGERINRQLNDALLETPASILLNSIAEIGPLLDREFINLVAEIDRGFANILSTIADFSQKILSGNILGIISGGANVGAKLAQALLGAGKADAESTRRANELAAALERLRSAIADNAVQAIELSLRYNRTTDSLRSLIGVSSASAEEFLKFSDIVKQVSVGFGEIKNFNQLQDFIHALEVEFSKLGDDGKVLLEILKNFFNELNLNQQQDFNALLEELGIVSIGIENFGREAKSVNSIVDDLRFEFQALKISDPTEQMRRFREELLKIFGFDLPESVDDARKFAIEGFDALREGGKRLFDFLVANNLEELTADQFRNLLQQIIDFADGVSSAVDDIKESSNLLAILLDRLNLEFNLLDVDDPIARLERLRQETKKQFGALIPETQDEIEILIKEGLAAFLAGGDALKSFLKSIDLEELTADQFRNFLEFLEGIADEAQKAADELSGGEERIGTSIVKSITFQQANVMLNELATIREILTQGFGGNFGLDSSFSILSSLNDIERMHYEASLQANVYLAQIADQMNSGGTAGINIFIVKGDTVTQVGINELEEMDRRIIEKSIIRSRARGVV